LQTFKLLKIYFSVVHSTYESMSNSLDTAKIKI